MAGGTVKQIITFDGVDNASKAADSVKKSMRGLSDEAKRASDGTAGAAAGAGKAIDTVREKSGDVESALKGISDFAGGASDQVSKMGDSFGAVEAVMRLLPGPIGIAAAAVAGLALGGKLAADYFSQADAKMRLLVSGPVKDLAAQLKVNADGAVALQQAFNDLEPGAIRPSAELLKQVGENAKAMGGDVNQAMVDLIAGFKGSDQELAKLQGRLGSFGVEVQSLDAIAKSLGFDNAALGLTAAKTAAEQLRKAEEDIRIARANADKAEADRRLAQITFESNAANQTNKAFLDRYSATIATADAANRVVKELESGAVAAANLVAEEVKHKQTLEQIAAIKQETEQKALLASDKETAKNIRLEGIKRVQDILGKAIAGSASETSAWAGKEAEARWESLKAMLGQEDVAKKQIADAEAAERKAAAASAAREARARREAAAAKAEREADQRHEEWRKGIDAIKRERDRLDAQAVRERVAGLNLERAQVGAQVEGEIRATLEVARIKRQAASDIAALQTDETLNRQARALETKRIEIEAETAVAAVRAAESKRIEDEGAKAFAALKTRAQDLIAIAAPAAEAAQAVAGPNGLGGALAEAAKQGSKLAASWSATEGNASGIIGAVGGVASAVVEGEKQKAAVLGVMEAAQAIALAFVPGKQAEAAAHGAAAVLYGGIASGLIGGSSTSGATAGATGGGFAPQAVGAQAPGTVAAVGTTVINFNAPLATRYEIGKDVVAAQKAAKAWAKAPAGV